MKKIGVLLALCVLLAVFTTSSSPTSAERLSPIRIGPRVEVTNFPAVQQVRGQVAVNNLPTVQEVNGAVAVTNLPVDESGNLQVGGVLTLEIDNSEPHFVGFTSISLVSGGFSLDLNRACNAEFPETRACDIAALNASVPPPPTWSDFVIASHVPGKRGRCIASDGFNVGYSPSNPTCNGVDSYPVACCGF